jgi:hypothetical protein
MSLIPARLVSFLHRLCYAWWLNHCILYILEYYGSTDLLFWTCTRMSTRDCTLGVHKIRRAVMTNVVYLTFSFDSLWKGSRVFISIVRLRRSLCSVEYDCLVWVMATNEWQYVRIKLTRHNNRIKIVMGRSIMRLECGILILIVLQIWYIRLSCHTDWFHVKYIDRAT